MFQYFPQPSVHLGSLEIRAYSITAVTAVLASLWTILRRAHRMGVSVEEMFRLWFVMYVCAMAGSHIYNIVVDQFSVFMSDPSIFFQLNGISSAGALNGGLWCGLLWCRYRGLSWLDICRRVDIATYAMPLAFMLGRLGCAFAHDHLGIPSNGWLAVNFPRGPRFDLGLIEFLFLAGVVILFHILDRRRRPLGFFFGLFGVLYGAFRLGLNTIRTEQEYVYGVAAIVIGAAGWFIMPALEKSQSATFPLPDDANRIAELLG